MAINLQEIQELLSAIGQSNVSEFELKTDDFELRISKGTIVAAPQMLSTNMAAPIAPAPYPQAPPAAPAPAPASAPDTPSAPKINDKWEAVTSPMVGTFYSAPAPGEAAFVAMGDRVSSGDTVCIIEAMKLMNEIETEVSGEVVKIVVEDGEPIEFGQTLMWVNPS